MTNRSDRLHKLSLKILGTGIGERTQTFVTGMSWVGSAAILSRIFSGTATILVARWMGPANFGEASVALAAALWIQIPLFVGIPTALMHYIPQKSISERPEWSATGFEVSCLFALATLTVGYFGRGICARGLRISEPVFIIALVWCGGFAVYTACTSILSGQEQFVDRARIELLFAILYPTIIFGLKFFKLLSAKSYIYALAIGYGIAGTVAIVMRISFSWNGAGFGKRARTLLSYGFISSAGGIVIAMIHSPSRLVANRYLSGGEVGILSAYYAVSIQMASSFVSSISQVFFPIASRTPNHYALLRKVRRLLIPGVILLSLMFAAMLFICSSILGKRYPLGWRGVIVFALAAALTTAHSLLSWFLAALGRRGNGISSIVGFIAGSANILGCLWFIPRQGVLGAGLASGLSSLVGIALCFVPLTLSWSGLEPLKEK